MLSAAADTAMNSIMFLPLGVFGSWMVEVFEGSGQLAVASHHTAIPDSRARGEKHVYLRGVDT
jgi:hypothetical protein